MKLVDGLRDQSLSKKQKGTGRVEFQTLQSDIQSAMDQGYSAKAVWQYLSDQNKISIGYRLFIKYVNRYLKQDVVQDTQVVAKEPEPPQNASSEPIQQQSAPARFEFSAKPKSLDELV